MILDSFLDKAGVRDVFHKQDVDLASIKIQKIWSCLRRFLCCVRSICMHIAVTHACVPIDRSIDEALAEFPVLLKEF